MEEGGKKERQGERQREGEGRERREREKLLFPELIIEPSANDSDSCQSSSDSAWEGKALGGRMHCFLSSLPGIACADPPVTSQGLWALRGAKEVVPTVPDL